MTESQDWRERKKARTRRALQEHALRLFAEQGYEATTVNQVAAAAGVSHMTFFRYFPTKEDVVLSDEYAPTVEALFQGWPAERSALDGLRTALAEGFREIYAADKDTIFERTALIVRTPALRARLWDQQLNEQRQWERVMVGAGFDEFEARVLAGVFRSALTTALIAWVESDGSLHLPTLMDDALAALGTHLVAAPADASKGT